MLVYAYPSGASAIETLLNFMVMLASVIGIIMFLIGIVRLILSFAQVEAQESQKAIFMIATAVTLLLMLAVLSSEPVKELIAQFRSLGHIISD